MKYPYSHRDLIPQMLGKKIVLTQKCWRQSAVNVKPFLLLSGPNTVIGYWFFVWAEKHTFPETIHIDREIQADILSKTKPLFCNVLLPELVGKYFTNSTNNDKSQDKWCICKMSEDEDDLIMCESKTCKIQWFHIKCMRIKKIPTKGKWFCVKCKTKKNKKKKDN